MTDILLTLISAALINNLVLHWPLALDPLLHRGQPAPVTRNQVHALGLATTCLMLVCGVIGQWVYQVLLVPLQLTSLMLLVFLPLSALLINPLLKLLSRGLPHWPFGNVWLLLLGNAGVLGLLLFNAQEQLGLGQAAAFSLGAGLGFWLVLSLFNDLRQRIVDNAVPLPFRGLPIDLISAGLMAVAFLGFNGLIKT